MKAKKLVLLMIFSLVIFGPAEVSYAAPSVSSVSGTVANGQAITINGSSFGSGPNVVFYDDFEKGTNGSALKTGSGSAQVGAWSAIDVPNVTYSSSQKISGNLALMSSPYAAWYLGGRGSISFSSASQVFVSYWTRTDAWPNNGVSVNWKALWIMGSGTTNHDMVVPTFLWEGGGAYVGNDAGGFADYNAPPLSLNKWMRMWALVNDSSTDTVKAWYLSSSGVVQNENGSGSIWSSGSFQKIFVPGNVEISGVNPHPMYDDVYVATGPNAQARVEIGNASTYNSCTNLAIATPTSWGSSSITATVRQGSLGSSSSAYLYVTDASGSVNSNGYPITFGGGTSPVCGDNTCNGTETCSSCSQDCGSCADTTPPAAPTGLSAQ
jgi:hypothetical protein